MKNNIFFIIFFSVFIILQACTDSVKNSTDAEVFADSDSNIMTDENDSDADIKKDAPDDQSDNIQNDGPDPADESIESDENDAPDEPADEDEFIPECIDGTKEYADCETSGKQVRECISGVWGDFSNCFDITAEVIDIADNSECINVYWADRGDAPAAYIKGMGLVFAGALCHSGRSDVALVSSAETSDTEHDALAWYHDIFAGLGMSNDTAGTDTLRHAYNLLTGLGIRESSGEHCCGRDTSATNTTADTAEAGLFQTSYNSHIFSTELDTLYSYWKDVKTLTPEKCLLEIFSQDVTCSESDWENFGVGEGVTFQALEKECPIFAAEYAAVMLRVSGGSKGHYGPLRTRAAEVRTECDSMFNEIQQLITENSDFCQFLVNY
ncbi:MAG TPA: hypothetical protein PLZ43_15465 [bacterium]|nr:hypothetical protein [bacterium]